MLYKQATEGDITKERPGLFDQVGRAKHDSWSKLKGMTKAQAEANYAMLISEIDPDFKSASGAWKRDIDGSEVLLH